MRQFPLKSLASSAMIAAVTGFGGYYLGVSKPVPVTTNLVSQNQSGNVLSASSLFQMQTAIVQGEITKVSDNNLTVKNETGKEEVFPISKRIVIYIPLKQDPKRAAATSDVNQIELNKIKLITFEVIDGKYQVVSVADLPKI